MDIFYESMKRDIEKFYDEFFSGETSRKENHLDALHRMYSFERFNSCGDLEKERVDFLTEVHEEIWGR